MSNFSTLIANYAQMRFISNMTCGSSIGMNGPIARRYCGMCSYCRRNDIVFPRLVETVENPMMETTVKEKMTPSEHRKEQQKLKKKHKLKHRKRRTKQGVRKR